ncbi:unnamed protein product [Linum trigynum]|uniref:Uncharacterized protein n=1 Tax=Linum trigynum TaxID=586398 RepID=A0AAV2CL54_9ROSI
MSVAVDDDSASEFTILQSEPGHGGIRFLIGRRFSWDDYYDEGSASASDRKKTKMRTDVTRAIKNHNRSRSLSPIRCHRLCRRTEIFGEPVEPKFDLMRWMLQ